MTVKKCPSCGGTDFVPYNYATGMSGYFDNQSNSVACLNCGMIILYANPDVLQKRAEQYHKEQAEKAERDRQISELQVQIDAKKAELEQLNAIVIDENQTVKAVKDAHARIGPFENDIRNLESTKASLSCTSPFRLF